MRQCGRTAAVAVLSCSVAPTAKTPTGCIGLNAHCCGHRLQEHWFARPYDIGMTGGSATACGCVQPGMAHLTAVVPSVSATTPARRHLAEGTSTQ
jgi:hypothetical protein